MFAIETTSARGVRVRSEDSLGPADFHAVAKRSGQDVFRARKAGLISARLCTQRERVETRWNGLETVNTADPFDFVVTSLDRAGVPLVDSEGSRNVYVIGANRFFELYEATTVAGPAIGGTDDLYRARSTVEAIFLPGGFEIRAPWGETQSAERGYLICSGQEVYGNNAETFEATYDRLAA